MRTIIIQIGLVVLIFIFAGLTFNQYSVKKEFREQYQTEKSAREKSDAAYLALVNSKVRIDTLYKDGKTVTKHDTSFQTITDTFLIDSGKVFGKFAYVIDSADLKLRAEIVASDLKSVTTTYSVREKIIVQQSILTEHDTLIQTVRKGQLLGVADIGLDNYGIGLQWQSKKRIGFGARYTRYNDDNIYSAVVSYRIR